MPIGDSISQPIPAVGTAANTAAAELVAFLQEVKARLEAKIALTCLLAGLFDLENHGLANAEYLGMYEQASIPTTPVGSFQRYNGDAYYVSPSGAVRITNGATLNVAAAQGITGDYGSGPEEFKYVTADLEYYAYSDEGTGKWARVAAQGFDIYGSLTGATRVRLAWAGGANPSYTLTLPATVPGAQSLMQMDGSGNVTASNTLPNDTNITLQGNGHILHGEYTDVHTFHYGTWFVAAGSPPSANDPAGPAYVPVTASSQLYYPVDVGDKNRRIKAIKVNMRAFSATATLKLYVGTGMGTGAVGLSALQLSGATTSTTLDVPADGLMNTRTLTLASPAAWHADGSPLWIYVQTPSGGTAGLVSYEVVYDVIS